MAKATSQAIELAKTAPLTQYVNSFVAELTAQQQADVRDNVAKIVTAQKAIVSSRLVIGECLAKLANTLGAESFNKFCATVGSQIGIKRSTAHRYLAGFKLVHGQFGTVAPDVLALTDGGNSIVKTEPKTGAIALTPEANMVLAKMPKIADNATPQDREIWARAYAKEVSKAGRGSGKSKTPAQMVSERSDRLWEVWQDLTLRINKLDSATDRRTALDEVREVIDKMVSDHAKMSKTINAVPAGKTPDKKAAA